MDNWYDLLNQARELCNSEKYSHALILINKAISLNPPFPPLHRAKAQILLKINNYSEALRVISSICETQPNDPKNWRVKGYVILFCEKSPSEDEILTAREALLEAKKNLKTGDENSWKKLRVCFQRLYSYSNEISDKKLAEQCIPPSPPPVRCPECSEVKSNNHPFCLVCGHKFE